MLTIFKSNEDYAVDRVRNGVHIQFPSGLNLLITRVHTRMDEAGPPEYRDMIDDGLVDVVVEEEFLT